MKENLKSYIALLVSMLFWSMTYIWTSKVLNYYNEPVTIISIRLIISSLFLLGLSFLLKSLQKLKKEHVKYFILLSFFQPLLYYIFETSGLQITNSPTTTGVIISTIPVFTPFIAYFFIKEKIKIMNYIGIFISFFGVLLVIFNSDFTLNVPILGVLILLAAVMSAVFYSVLLKKIMDYYNVLTLNTFQNMFGLIWFTPLFLYYSMDEIKNVSINLELTYYLLGLAIFGSSLAYLFFSYGVKILGVSKSSVFTNTIPVITAGLSYFLYNETLTITKVLGIIIVVLGLFLAQIQVEFIKRSGRKLMYMKWRYIGRRIIFPK